MKTMSMQYARTSCTLGLVVGLAALSLLGGCRGQAKKAAETWTPKPRVGWEQIVTTPVAPIEEGYRVLLTEPTRGLFPASLAVSRIAITGTRDEPEPQPHLFTDPRNEFLQWNSAFDDLMAVSEVFPIAERTLGGGDAQPEQILAAFRALDARLGLVYAVNELSATETEMIAVLYDVRAGRPLACYRTHAVSVTPPEHESKKKKEEVDPWTTDSRALVRAKFERHAHACLRELTLKDVPAELEDKSGWAPERPQRPAEWPPRTDSARP